MSLKVPSTKDHVQYYVNLILNTRPDEMKVLLLDRLTMDALTLVCSNSDLLQKNYLYINLITHKPRERMENLHCVVFVSPTSLSSVEELCVELKNPHYKDYTIFFSHRCPLADLRDIAASDAKERVENVKELYFNFQVIDQYLCILPSRRILPDNIHPALSSSILSWVMINSIGVIPDVYFQKGSRISERCAGHVHSWMTEHTAVVETETLRFLTHEQQETVQEFNNGRNILLIFDRRLDPVTPLLQQWTYQAMVHEIFGLQKNVVKISTKYSKKDEEEIEGEDEEEEEEEDAENDEYLEVSLIDEFYNDHKFDNWGDLCLQLKEQVTKIRRVDQKHNQQRNESGGFQSIDEIRNYVDHLFLSSFQKDSKNISDHVNIVFSMKRAIKLRKLLRLSPIEQSLACQRDHKKVLISISKLLKPSNPSDEGITGKGDHSIEKPLLINLCLLFFLRFNSDSTNRRRIINIAKKFQELSDLEADLIERFGLEMKEYMHPLLFKSDSIFFDDSSTSSSSTSSKGIWKGLSFLERMINTVSGLNDVKNIFIQHKPLLDRIIGQIASNKEPSKPFGRYIAPRMKKKSGGRKAHLKKPIKKVLIYIIGGATYEENKFIHEYNMKRNKKFTMYLCGDEMLNSRKFRKNFHKNKFED